MKKINLFSALLLISTTCLFAQCPTTVQFSTTKNNCNYVFTNNSTGSYGGGHFSWFINSSPCCSTAYSDSNVLSGTFFNGEVIYGCYYDQFMQLCNCANYTVGCGAGCPGIIQNITATYTGNGMYTFKDSSVGQDTSARYGWTIGGNQISPTHGDSVVYSFQTTQNVVVCDTIIEPNCATTYLFCKSFNVIGCPFITQNWYYIDSPHHVVTFVDQSTHTVANSVIIWTFGDGTTDSTIGAGTYVIHTYPDTGQYTVCETISTPGCTPNTACRTAYVYYQPPCTTFTPIWTYALHGADTVALSDATIGLDSDAIYTWTFSTGGIDTGKNITHIFSDTAVTYQVCERIQQYSYCNTYPTTCKTIRVIPCQSVNQNFNDSYNSTSHVYSFRDTSTGQDASASYFWEFGDDSTSHLGRAVTHSYIWPATYRVCEIITDAGCSPDTVCKNVIYNPCTYTIHQNFTVTQNGNNFSLFDASTGTDFNAGYAWTCTGQASQTGSAVVFIVPTYGQYHVCEILSEPGCLADTFCKTIDYVHCPTITQNVNYSVTNAVGSAYTFTDASTGQDTAATYSWNFGDGHTGTGSPVNHTYAASGNYTLTETITEPGCTPYVATGTITVTICPSITPSFTSTHSQEGTYTFTSTSTGQDANATISWSFGDGSPSGSGSPVSHTYSASGSYYVYMTITEPGCTSYNYGETITVVVCPSIALSFTSWDHGGGSFTFTDASTGPDANAVYAWTFGDSSTGTGTSAGHTYASSGTYTVCETVTEPHCSAYPPYCQQVDVNILDAGINNIQGSTISIHPNPTSETLTIDMGTTDLSDGCVISIVNQLGQESMRQTDYSEISSVNVSGLPDGIYIIDIKAGSVEYRYPISIIH